MDLTAEQIAAIAAALAPALAPSITSQVEALGAKLLKEVDNKNSGLAASIQRELAKTTGKKAPKPAVDDADDDAEADDAEAEAKPAKRPSVRAVEARITELEAKLETEKKAARISQRNEGIREVLGGKVAPERLSTAMKLFLMDHESQIQEDEGEFFVGKGDSVKTLKGAVEAFLESSDGQMFRPAGKGKGSGLNTSNAVRPPAGKGEDNLADRLFTDD